MRCALVAVAFVACAVRHSPNSRSGRQAFHLLQGSRGVSAARRPHRRGVPVHAPGERLGLHRGAGRAIRT